jgi:hypothetical protein
LGITSSALNFKTAQDYMKNFSELTMTEDGAITRRTVTEEVIDAGESVIESISTTITRKAQNVFEVPGWGPVNLAINVEGCYYSMRLNKLPLKANFKIHEGILYPKFSASKEPVISMVWTPPTDMKLVMLILMHPDSGKVFFEYQWIFAFDLGGRAYRLPLGNLFDDAKLCTGSMENVHPTAQAVFVASLEQLERSQWQGDLDRSPESTQKMFRFKPVDAGFEQQPSIGAWSSLCLKISHAAVNLVNV